MSVHFHRAVSIALALLLVIACGKSDPFDEKTIARELKTRSVEDLYDELEKISYSPPANGRLTEVHISKFVTINSLALRIVELSDAHLRARLTSTPGGLGDMGTTFSAFGNARDAAMAQPRAALMLGENPREFEWTYSQIRDAARFVADDLAFRTRVASAKSLMDRSVEAETRARNTEQYRETEATYRRWRGDLSAARVANLDLVEKHAKELAPYIRDLR